MNQRNQEMKLQKVIDTLNIQQFGLYLFIKYQGRAFRTILISQNIFHIFIQIICLYPKWKAYVFFVIL